MKRCLSLFCLLLAVVLLPSAAMAMSQAEWNQECRSKTSGETTLYAVGNEDALTIDDAQLTVVGSLPGGTYIKTGSYHRELGMWDIAYWQNGGRASAWIMRDSITDATRWVYYTDGSGDPLPEALANDRAALESYIQRMHPDKVIYGDGTKPVSIDGTLPLEQLPEEETNKKPATTEKVKGDWSEEQEASEAEKAFNAECPWRLKRNVTGYSDPKLTKRYETINIGTYCRIVNDFDDVVKIAYYKNGEQHSACIEKAALLGSYTQYKAADGNTYSINSGHPDHDKIIQENEVTWLAESVREGLDAQVDAQRAVDTKPSSKKATTSKSSAPKAEKLELSLTMAVPEGKLLAVVYTPNSGKCTLREKASDSGKTIKQSKAGHLVLVLEKGNKYTKINDNGYVGYVQTRCLKFFEELPEAMGTAKLSYNGKVTGKTTVNIRHEASKSSRKVEEWRTGTTVTVFSYADGWYEIEHDGVYGFVMDDFLTMNE